MDSGRQFLSFESLPNGVVDEYTPMGRDPFDVAAEHEEELERPLCEFEIAVQVTITVKGKVWTRRS